MNFRIYKLHINKVVELKRKVNVWVLALSRYFSVSILEHVDFGMTSFDSVTLTMNLGLGVFFQLTRLNRKPFLFCSFCEIFLKGVLICFLVSV